jgi:hypothetical protein
MNYGDCLCAVYVCVFLGGEFCVCVCGCFSVCVCVWEKRWGLNHVIG